VEKPLPLWKTWRKTGSEVMSFPIDTVLNVTFQEKGDLCPQVFFRPSTASRTLRRL
jgi:hypothetical protein